MTYADSPPPQIIQLRDLLQSALDRERSYTALPRPATIEALELAHALAERLIEQYPVLTRRSS